jgi:hypothetical protein
MAAPAGFELDFLPEDADATWAEASAVPEAHPDAGEVRSQVNTPPLALDSHVEAPDASASVSEADANVVEADANALEALDAFDLGEGAESLWRSQLESQDPFVAELAQLMAGTTPEPLGIFAAGSADCALSEASLASHTVQRVDSATSAVSRAVAADDAGLEPLSLEGFIRGDVLPLPSAPTRVQGLNELELSTSIETLSAAEHAWQDLLARSTAFLLARGATHAAIILPRLLAGEAVSVTRLPRAAQQCLVAEDFASEHDGVVLVRPEFRARARRMQRTVRDGDLDKDALNRWLASVLRAVLASPRALAELQSELAAAGVGLDVRAA